MSKYKFTLHVARSKHIIYNFLQNYDRDKEKFRQKDNLFAKLLFIVKNNMLYSI